MPKNFVPVRSKATGKKQLVPEHFLTNPVLKDRFELTPSAKAADAENATPATVPADRALDPPTQDDDASTTETPSPLTETPTPGVPTQTEPTLGADEPRRGRERS